MLIPLVAVADDGATGHSKVVAIRGAGVPVRRPRLCARAGCPGVAIYALERFLAAISVTGQRAALAGEEAAMTGRTAVALAGVGAGIVACWVRPRLPRWGATEEEVTGAYPGAEEVPGGERAATMAVTIGAPPERVWPWLVQVGWDRGG
jgi:hypothetical protein